MREYALVCCIAAAVTFLLTPVVRVVARRWGAVARPRCVLPSAALVLAVLDVHGRTV